MFLYFIWNVKSEFENPKFAIFDTYVPNIVTRYEDNLRFIFDQQSKLYLRLNAEAEMANFRLQN